MKTKLSLIMYSIFGLCFTFVCLSSIFKNMYFEPSSIVTATFLSFLIISIISSIVLKYCNISEKNYKRTLVIFSVLFLSIEIIIGLKWQYDPQFDIGAVHKGAIEWVKTGTFESYYEYFSACPNNIGPMLFLFIFAKFFSMFGLTNFYALFIIINSIIITTSIVLVSLTCKRISGIKHAILSLIFFTFSIQLWFMSGAVYSDAMSMMFPILIFWLYTVSKDNYGKKKLLIYIFIAISTAIGALIKMPVMIMSIAIIIDLLIKKEFKESLKLITCMVVIYILISGCVNTCIYSNHLDKEHKKIVERPYVHHIMMGLEGDGRYNSNDFAFTDSFSDPTEKRNAIKQEISNRINSRGFSGMYDLIFKKSILDFGDGTYGMADFLDQPSESKTKLRDLVLYDGKYYETYGTCVTGIHIAIMIILLLGAYMRILNKDKRNDNLFAPYLSLLGLWLFLMCWETNRRYFSNFIPIIYLCAILNCDIFNSILSKCKEKLESKFKN